MATSALGSKALYEFLNLNPAVEFHPTDYVNDMEIIARHHKMVSMNVAQTVDLAGQVSSDAVAATLFAGVSGIPDFVRGSNRSVGGRSIIMLGATADAGARSRIVPLLDGTIVTLPRQDVRWVVTEFGAVNLFGKSTQERAMAMISIAHPDFRDELLDRAKAIGMIGPKRRLGEAVRGVYPVQPGGNPGHRRPERDPETHQAGGRAAHPGALLPYGQKRRGFTLLPRKGPLRG